MRKININKDWKFKKEAWTLGQTLEGFTPVELPHCWNAEDGTTGGNNYYRGVCTYTKNLKVEAFDGRLYLDFEGANSIANVYINDVHLGEHQGGYSGFRYDITDHVKKGENQLIVQVDNRHNENVYPLFADFTFYGGIYRDVNLIYTNSIHFEKTNLASSGVFVSQNHITDDLAELSIKADVLNMGSPAEVLLDLKLLDRQGKAVATASQSQRVTDKSSFNLDLNLEQPILWQGVENPYLYTLEAVIIVDGQVLDRESIATGLRYYEFHADKGFLLNGKQVKLKGVSRHQDRSGVGNALTKAHQIEDMNIIKSVGANSIRLAHYQHNQFFYDLCDQYGMIVWAEIPYISKTSDTDPTASNAISQMRELIRQSYNHASIVMWGVQNEVGMMNEEKPLAQISKEIHDVAKEEDPTRLTTQAQVMMIEVDDPAHQSTDVVAYNKYYGWYVGEAEEFEDFLMEWRKENPNKPLGISEYGAEGILKWHTETPEIKDYTEEYHALYHEKVMKIFNKHDFVWGTYVWNFFDFGSDLRDEGGIQGMNNKGLVTFDRSIKKDAFYFYQSIWTDQPMLHISGKRFEKRHLESTRVKVYSNLEHVTLTANGRQMPLIEKDGTVFIFEVALKEGDNLVTAIADKLVDTAVFEKVDEPFEDYILPESEKKDIMGLTSDENIRNWFDMDLDTSVETFEYPEGFFNIKDKIIDLLDHDGTKGVLDEYFKGMEDHPMFDMVKGMSVKAIMDFQKEQFPLEARLHINAQLNKIKR